MERSFPQLSPSIPPHESGESSAVHYSSVSPRDTSTFCHESHAENAQSASTPADLSVAKSATVPASRCGEQTVPSLTISPQSEKGGCSPSDSPAGEETRGRSSPRASSSGERENSLSVPASEYETGRASPAELASEVLRGETKKSGEGDERREEGERQGDERREEGEREGNERREEGAREGDERREEGERQGDERRGVEGPKRERDSRECDERRKDEEGSTGERRAEETGEEESKEEASERERSVELSERNVKERERGGATAASPLPSTVRDPGFQSEVRTESAFSRSSAYSIVYSGRTTRSERTEGEKRSRGGGASATTPSSSSAARSRGEENTRFECNICFDEATDPVVTRCGHLFCWTCLHAWLRRGTYECPVCKAHTTVRNVIPIYGRGAEKHPRDASETGNSGAGSVPERPRAERPEPEPQSRSGASFGGGTGGATFSFGLFPFFGLGVTWGGGVLNSGFSSSASSAFDWLFFPPGAHQRDRGAPRQDQVLTEEQQRMQSLGFLLLAFCFVLYIIFLA
ncbi:zinc finger, C3HC4 type (RING finger) domain-containing protein [Toxoplasma gondii TgCatPRC2]|uniref:RING-type E3 ubiquitin transferase n=2 Tax=Toxoplasma gondii TaxID=5811 RepID=A0A151HAC0_TOXGO|nr:zinc finger, C3HC4 type (RING finger) domain-containing protein [Toxoplasma gondii ME49]EPT29953.1 zinc finger, C3HC4 type (RING finger) domain-containing protein [Toxoplasma gondii ME49]KYK66277.1 zinc finger, C3HC4 type (RING finger) domain-containing protein [Toxoplasma gondii TgCatPRC2]|eukprot:XP_018637268.1 zinc finger, C3HC4 type (RING finger) domain-containing protein [Toxoplasma gondii ME49]